MKQARFLIIRLWFAHGLLITGPAIAATECDDWQARQPDWIWCDDFENDARLQQDYFEVNRANDYFGVSDEAAYQGKQALKVRYLPGKSESGNIKLGFGKSPLASSVSKSSGSSAWHHPGELFEDVYWRFYLRQQPGWQGNPQKLTRATIFTDKNWSQAAVAHLWQNRQLGLMLDPVSAVTGDRVSSKKYNDFSSFKWLGAETGTTEIYEPARAGTWLCIEVHMKLNTPGEKDGVFEFWVDGEQEAIKDDLNWRGSYSRYGINAIFLENYATGGMPVAQTRYWDNFVVSRQRIGCHEAD